MTFLPQEIIRKKRNSQTLTDEEISFFIKGVTDGSIADAQTAALTMAIFLNGFSRDETVALTLNMRDSGDVLQWPDIDGPVVDKHSSGGVGDKVSLMLAPMIAACGGWRLCADDFRPRARTYRRHARQIRFHSRLSNRA